MSSLDRYKKYINSIMPNATYDFRDKQSCFEQYIAYMLDRTRQMFNYENLPATIPERILEIYLQTNGNACFYEFENNLYVFVGGLGGKPDPYFMPTKYIISNPALNISKELDIDSECVVVPSDSLYLGLMPLFSRYASALVENDLSLNIASINSRIISLISAGDDSTFDSAKKYIEDIEAGNSGIIAENAFLDGVKAQPYGSTANSNALTNLIEYEQYLKASWFNELGLNSNYNMKREAINSNESQLNDDMLHPLIDDMLECRKIGLDKVNKMYGTNIKVTLNSSWQINDEEMKHAVFSGQTENEREDENVSETK